MTTKLSREQFEAEVLEMNHHDTKDAPSGTAERLIEILKDQLAKAKSKEELSVYPIIMPMVVPSKNEIYLCTSIDLSQTNETFWIRGFEPRVSKSNVHHMIVAASETKPPQSPFNVWNCGNDRVTK